MRQVLQVTFQALTKNSKLTPEFLNILFVITFLQVAVFGHYYQHSQRPHFATASYEAQDETLQMNQPYETVLKEVLPLLRIYFTDSPKQFSSEILRVINKINMSNTNFYNILKNKENILLIEDFIRTIDDKELLLKILPIFSRGKVSFDPKDGNEMQSMEPDPINPEPVFVSSSESQESSTQSMIETASKERELKGRFKAPSTRKMENILLKEDFIRTIAGEELTLKALPLFSKEDVSFHAKDGNEWYSFEPDLHNPELLSQSFQEGLALEALSASLEEEILPQIQVGHEIHFIEPDPVNLEPLFVSSSESQESSTQNLVNTSSEEKEHKVHIASPSTRELEDLIKKNLTDNIELKKEKKLPRVEWWLSDMDPKPSVFNLLVQKFAPTKRTPLEDIPLHMALLNTLFSNEFRPHITPFGWFKSKNEDTKKSARRSDFFHAYFREIKWENTNFEDPYSEDKGLIRGEEDWHLVDSDLYSHVYDLPRHLTRVGGFIYEDEDICG